MEITVEKLDNDDVNYSYEEFTVYVEDYRILTILTDDNKTATKWLHEVQKILNGKNKHGNLVVGICAYRISDRHYPYLKKYGHDESPYHLLQLCVGSHCLIWDLGYPDTGKRYRGYKLGYLDTRALKKFLSDNRVKSVAMNINSIVKNLDKYHDVKIANPLDLNSLAVKLIPRDHVDLMKYNLDQLVKEVFGRSKEVSRPEKTLDWIEYTLDKDEVKYATVDAYLCFLLGCEFLDLMSRNKKIEKNQK